MFKKILRWIGITLAVIVCLTLIAAFVQLGRGMDYYAEDGSFQHITDKQSFNYISQHPAFEGFGNYVVPCEGSLGCAVLTPLQIKRSIGYLSKSWDVETIVNSINFLIDEVNAGKTIYYDFYSAEEIASDPSKDDTGLFFIEGGPGAPFALVLAGGGFTSVAMIQESYPIGLALHEQGYNVFLLRYRIGTQEGDTDFPEIIRRANHDTAAALSYIFDNADRFNVSTEGYSVWGFSAGGTLTLLWGSETESGYANFDLPAPTALIMGYPAASLATAEVQIPVFIASCKDDTLTPSIEEYVAALEAAGTEVEFHVYETCGHGFGVGVGTDAEGWINFAIDFWNQYLD